MAYNNGREDRKWRIWKEAEEKVLREHGVDEATIEQIRIDDRADFNSNRRFYHWTSDFGEYLEGMADREQSAEVKTVEDLLDEIEDENLYQASPPSPICTPTGRRTRRKWTGLPTIGGICRIRYGVLHPPRKKRSEKKKTG